MNQPPSLHNAEWHRRRYVIEFLNEMKAAYPFVADSPPGDVQRRYGRLAVSAMVTTRRIYMFKLDEHRTKFLKLVPGSRSYDSLDDALRKGN